MRRRKKKAQQNIIEETTAEITEVEETSDEISEDAADETVEEDSDGTVEGASDEISEDAAEETSDEIVEEASEETVEEISDEIVDEATDEESEDDEEFIEADDEDEEEDEEEIRRRLRHKRRVRNQIISYIVTAVILAVIGVGIFFAAKYILAFWHEKQAEKIVEAEIEAIDAEEEEEETVIEPPENLEPEITAEEEEEEEIPVEVDYLGEMVNSVISEMPIEDKVAQLFMITPEALTGVDTATKAGDGTKEALNTYAIAGLVYGSKNITDAEQITEMLTNTVGMSKYELFLVAKEPGGDMGTVAGSPISGVPPVELPSDIATSGDAMQAYNAGATVASYLCSYGFNVNIAPSGDLVTDENALSAKLSYGNDEAATSDMVAQMVSGMKSGKMGVCMTNFPGTGNITESTADQVVESEMSADDITGQLVPYVSGIAAGADMIMMNNVTYTVADGAAVPASMSEYMISTVLRGNMGYEGIIVTGPLNDKAVTENFTSAEASIAAFKAGADILYMPADFEEAYQGMLTAAQDGTISEERIDETLTRIFRMKFADDVE